MADVKGSSGNKTSGVALSQLPLQQLEYLRGQIEEEVKMLTESVSRLKGAQQKFYDSMDNVGKLRVNKEGSEILIPMTSSMYVPGKTENLKNVVVEIGTGYYAEKTLQEADDYFKRKIDFITKQVEKIQPIHAEKQAFMQAITETMNAKIQQQLSTSKLTEQTASMKT
ncbi:prefoldin subunit 5-like [Rhopilema esculentum]|uniref:prefoldin subunit 5-like n=1 Tax=Rhopilema esculentum TaxID=499914 RepID=UPI0031CED64E